MIYALNLNKETKRCLSATCLEYAAPDAVFVKELPEGNLPDYLYIDGGYVYDPLPQPEPVDPGPSDHELLMALLGVYE